MILCDIDGVLATGPTGDTAVGEPIYRTWPHVPEELQRIRDAGIPFHVVTARVGAEAAQVLRAIGLDGYPDSVTSADSLFWPSVWAALRRGRIPEALSKGAYRPIRAEPGSGPVVMIENHQPHLIDMLAAGIIDFGVLVPPITIKADQVSRWFDLELALRLARKLVTNDDPSSELRTSGIGVFAWTEDDLEELDARHLPLTLQPGKHLFRLPGFSSTAGSPSAPTLGSLDTGQILDPGGGSLVTAVRQGRRLVRRMRRLLLNRSDAGSSKSRPSP
jgi:hypothetical protein